MLPQARSPLMRRASCMSLGMMVTLQGSTAGMMLDHALIASIWGA
jgi:hypothetical protein